MSSNTGSWKHTGPATLSFDGGKLINVSDCAMRFTPGLSRYDNIQDADGVLDITCPSKGIEFAVKIGSLNLDTFSWSSGYNGHTGNIGSAKVLYFNQQHKTLPEGPFSAAFTRNDDKACRVYMKRAKAVPVDQSVKFTKDTPTEFDVVFVMLDPGDGTVIAGQFEEGSTT